MPVIIPSSSATFTVDQSNENYFLPITSTISSGANGIFWQSGTSGANLSIAGTIFVNFDALRIGSSAGNGDDENLVTIANTGYLFGGSDGIEVFSDSSGVTNYGFVGAQGDAGIQLVNSTFDTYVNNYGDISAALYAIYADGDNASVFNAGNIAGAHGVNINGNNANVVNTGSISGNVPAVFQTFLGLDDAAGIHVRGDDARITNSGTISGLDYSIEVTIFASNTVIFNSGLLLGDVLFDTQDEILRNSGVIDGDITLGAGSDLYRAFGDAIVSGTIDGGEGDDIIVGVAGDDEFYGGADADVLRGNAGEDVLYGGTGNDVLSGGFGDDVLYGGDDVDRLFGKDGEDILFGGAGNDILSGDEGLDILYGGTGSDRMFGGAGADQFIFTSLAESPDTNTGRDIIRDFEQGVDLIGVSQLSMPAFAFIGSAAFSGSGPELRVVANAAGDTNVYLDADGNGVADMRILVSDITSMTADDFIL